ncbi:hypothetical protein IGI04_014701, partial [Brassica rapa subsp. trilocularis]
VVAKAEAQIVEKVEHKIVERVEIQTVKKVEGMVLQPEIQLEESHVVEQSPYDNLPFPQRFLTKAQKKVISKFRKDMGDVGVKLPQISNMHDAHLGRYIPTERRTLGRYVATERGSFSRCVTNFFELSSVASYFHHKAFRKKESVSKKYLSKKLALQLVRVEILARGLTILAKLGVLDEVYTLNSAEEKLSRNELFSFIFFTPSLLLTFKNLSSSKTFAFNMSSSQGDKRDSDVEMGEATSPAPILTFPFEAPRLVCRQVEKELVRAGTEFPSSSARAIAPGHGTEVVVPQDIGTLAGSGIPDAQALPGGSSTTLIIVEDKERAADSMPPPSSRKEIVLALRAPSAVPVAQPKGRKRKLTKGNVGESSQQGGSRVASGLRGKFMLLINGMISKCGSETSCLAGELVELQGRWSETEAMLTAVKDSHSAKVSKLEVAIGELERVLGKTASSLLKEKKARKAKSSERAAGSERPQTLFAQSFILADLKSACFLPTCSEDQEGKDPMAGENRGDTAPGLDEARRIVWKEGDELSSHILLRCEMFRSRSVSRIFSARYRFRGISEDVEYKHRGMVLGSRIFLISCLEMLETSALGLGQDLGLLSVLRFMRISPETIFKPTRSAGPKFWVSFIAVLSLCRMYESHLREMAMSV